MGDKTARVLETRQRILDILKQRGPSLPVHVAKSTGVSMIFAGAFLSELIGDKQVKTSHLRVGGSPLYLLPGQESLLENFSQFLNSKEKEAYLLLKEQKILRDDQMEPAIRVALRNIKDFAEQIIVKQKLEDFEKEFIFWRFFLFSDDEAKKIIENILEPKKEKKEEKKVEKKDHSAPRISEVKKEEIPAEKLAKSEARKEKKVAAASAIVSSEEVLPLQREMLGNFPAPEAPQKTEFANAVLDFLQQNEISLIEEKIFSKKEYEGVVEIQTVVGPLKMYAVARDKKAVGDAELMAAVQKAQNLRLPVLFLAPGKVNKKGQDYLDKWHAFAKFKRMG